MQKQVIVKSFIVTALLSGAQIVESAELKSSFSCSATVQLADGKSVDYYQLPLQTTRPTNSESLEKVYEAAVLKKSGAEKVDRVGCWAIDEARPESSLAVNLRAIAEMKSKGFKMIELKISY